MKAFNSKRTKHIKSKKGKIYSIIRRSFTLKLSKVTFLNQHIKYHEAINFPMNMRRNDIKRKKYLLV